MPKGTDLAVGNRIGAELVKALGLEGKAVEAIDIRVRRDEAVSVMVRFVPTFDAFGECIQVLKHYTLHDEDPNTQTEG